MGIDFYAAQRSHQFANWNIYCFVLIYLGSISWSALIIALHNFRISLSAEPPPSDMVIEN